MNEVRITLASRKTILFGSGSTLAQRVILISPFYIRTTMKRHVESGQSVYAPAAPARSVFEFVTPREDTAGFSVVQSRCARATEFYCIGSGSISTLKIGNKQSFTSGRDSALRIWVAGPSMLLGSTIGLLSCSGFMGLIRTARRQQWMNIWR